MAGQMNAAPLRAALIGCGRIGAGFAAPSTGAVLTHAAAYNACALTKLVAVYDSNGDSARTCAEAWGVAGFADLDQMLEATMPDVVSICTPDGTHAMLADRVLNAPSVRGVLLEKPLALTISDAENTVRLAEKRKVVLAVNYSRRWATGIRAAAALVQQGRLGAVRTVTGHYANGWIHNGTHWIDLARMFVGEVTKVRVLRERESCHAGDSLLDVEIEFASGAHGIAFGHAGVGLSFFEMDLVCEFGRVRLSRGAEQIDIYELAPSPTFAGFFEHTPFSSTTAGLGRSMLLAVEDVALCVLEGGSPACTGHDGVAALRVAHAGLSARGSWMRVEAGH